MTVLYIWQNLTDSTSRSLSCLSSTYHPFISPVDWQFCSAPPVATGPRRPFYPAHYVPPVVPLRSIWSIWRWKGLKASIQGEPRYFDCWWIQDGDDDDDDDEEEEEEEDEEEEEEGGGLRTYHIHLLWSFRRLCHSFNLDGCLDGLKLPKSIIARYHCFILGQKDSACWHRHSSIPWILLLNHQST